MQDSVGQMADVLRHGGAVQQVLTLGGEVLDDAPDVGQEAMSSIMSASSRTRTCILVRSTVPWLMWSSKRPAGDDNVDAAPERIDLWVDADATVDSENGEASLATQVAKVLGDLFRQFEIGRASCRE